MSALVRADAERGSDVATVVPHPLGSWAHIEPEWTCVNPKLLGFEDVDPFLDVYRAHVASALVCPAVGDLQPRNLHRRVAAWVSLPAGQDRARFESMFRWHVGTFAHEFARHHAVSLVAFVIGTAALMALGILAVPLAAWRTGRTEDVAAIALGMAAACVPFGLAVAAGYVGNQGRPLWQRTRTRYQQAVPFVLPVCLVAVAAATFDTNVSTARYLAGTGFVVSSAALFLAVFPGATLWRRVTLARWRRWLRRHPREALSYQASAIVHHLTEHSWRWGTTGYMEMLATRIERFADWAERGIPGYLRSGDPSERRRLDELGREVAAATRATSTLLRADRADDALARYFVELLPAVAFGRWEDLPTAPAPPVERRPRPSVRTLVAGVLVGVVPLVVLYVLQSTSLRLGEPLRSGFAAAFLVHAVVHAYARLGWDDGPYPTLLETMRRLRGGPADDVAHGEHVFRD